jgi:hypothetical protein
MMGVVVDRPYWQGFDAGRGGSALQDCPHDYGTPEYRDWVHGWCQGHPRTGPRHGEKIAPATLDPAAILDERDPMGFGTVYDEPRQQIDVQVVNALLPIAKRMAEEMAAMLEAFNRIMTSTLGQVIADIADIVDALNVPPQPAPVPGSRYWDAHDHEAVTCTPTFDLAAWVEAEQDRALADLRKRLDLFHPKYRQRHGEARPGEYVTGRGRVA